MLDFLTNQKRPNLSYWENTVEQQKPESLKKNVSDAHCNLKKGFRP